MCEIEDSLAVMFSKKFIEDIENKLRFKDEDFILKALLLKAYYIGQQLHADTINPFINISHKFQGKLIDACSNGRLSVARTNLKKTA